MGTNFANDRGNVAFSVEYNKQDGALADGSPELEQQPSAGDPLRPSP